MGRFLRRSPSKATVAFFLMGTLNNLTFVVNAAGASELLPGQVALVYIINSSPELLVKGTAPLWWHWSSYGSKIAFAGFCFATNLVLVSSGLQLAASIQLVGVALSNIGGGLGEATMLAYSQLASDPATCISAWSSGTGAAGVLGYLISMFVLPQLGPPGRLVLATVIVASFLGVFFGMLHAERNKAAPYGQGARLLSSEHEHGSVEGGADSSGGWCSQTDAVGGSSPPSDPQARSVLGLVIKYVLPLVLIYWAEYAMQSGAWTAFALPAAALASDHARTRAYQALNLAYQAGVLTSRSSGKLCTLSLSTLWLLAVLQCVLLALFIADGAAQQWTGASLSAPAFLVGLLGGTSYVQTCLAIDRAKDLNRRSRELALAAISVGAPIGIVLADFTGLVIQSCLMQAHHLHIDGGARWCPARLP